MLENLACILGDPSHAQIWTFLFLNGEERVYFGLMSHDRVHVLNINRRQKTLLSTLFKLTMHIQCSMMRRTSSATINNSFVTNLMCHLLILSRIIRVEQPDIYNMCTWLYIYIYIYGLNVHVHVYACILWGRADI